MCNSSVNDMEAEAYQDKFKELILDEDEILTCQYVKHNFNLCVWESAEVLKIFLDNHRKSKPKELVATYLIVGTLAANDCEGSFLIKEDELESKKKLFKVIESTSVYSVQKSKTVDFDAIAMVDTFTLTTDEDNEFQEDNSDDLSDIIIGRNCVKRNVKAQTAIPVEQRSAPKDKSKATHLFTKVSPKKEKEVLMKTIKKEPETIKKPDNEKKNLTKATNIKASQKGLQSFFSKTLTQTQSKATVKTSESDEKMEVDEDDDQTSTQKNKNELYDSDTDEEAKKIEESNKKKAPVTASKSAKKRKKSPQKGKDNLQKPEKRRKRIIERNDSDSDDIFGGDHDSEEENFIIESDDEVPIQKVTVLAPKNKKRKLISKTYTDEEGYLVTQREYVYESGSDKEDEDAEKEQMNPQIEKKPVVEKKPAIETKPAGKEISPTKVVKGKKGAKAASKNQPSIMNFFNKK